MEEGQSMPAERPPHLTAAGTAAGTNQWIIDTSSSVRMMAVNQRRAFAAAAYGIVLAVSLVAIVFQTSPVVVMQEAQSSTVSSRASNGAKIQVPHLSSTEKSKLQAEIMKLEVSVKANQKIAITDEVKVEKEEVGLKKSMLKAKEEREEGDKMEKKARALVKEVSVMKAKAQKLRDESEAARKKFVAEEKPVELASQLVSHDHKLYRGVELALAHDVTVLSEDPGNKKLHAKVDKLVAKSKRAKSQMESDTALFNKLQQKAASSQISGDKSFGELKQKSVDVAKQAEVIARHAESLADDGHHYRDEASKTVNKVEAAMTAPDALYKKVLSARKEYKEEGIQMDGLRKKLDAAENAQAAAMHHKSASTADSSYGSDRIQLEKDLHKEGISVKDSRQSRSNIEETAERKYDELEKDAMMKERKASQLARENRQGIRSDEVNSDSDSDSSSRDSSSSENGSMQRVSEDKHAHILSSEQSTFLSGLFSTKAPWDKSD